MSAPAPTRTWTVEDLVPPGTSLTTFLSEFAPPTVDPAGTFEVRPVDYAAGSPATGALLRVVDAPGSWSAFVKVINHLRHWPVYPFLPPAFAERFAAEFDWRGELVLWEPAITAYLPDGLRVPVLHTVADLGDDRLAVWMEDVPLDSTPWDRPRYGRAAELLGRFTARRSAPEVLATSAVPVGHGLRKFALEGLPQQLAGGLDDDGTWSRADLAPLEDLRKRLLQWRDRIPELLERMDTFPQAMPHGDASPQNLLVPAGPDTAQFVVIDASFQAPQAVGFDLGQLIVGLVQAGAAGTDGLPALRDEVLTQFLAGYRAEPGGAPVDPDEVRAAFAATLLIRSGFTALPLGRPGGDTTGPTLAARADLTRFVLDTADAWWP